MTTVIVCHELPLADRLDAQSDDLSVIQTTDRDDAVAQLSDAEVLVCNSKNWDDRFVEALHPGDWVQVTSAGYDAFPVESLNSRGVIFTNAAGIHASVVAEHVFALSFAFSRKIPELACKQANGVWGPRTRLSAEMTDWKGRTMTIYGLGEIGEEIAKRGLVFDMNVYGVKRNPEAYRGGLPAERVLSSGAFHEVLPETDLLVASVPLTEHTRGSIDGAVFSALPDSAILINVSRGAVVNEQELLTALQTGQIAGAGLDVFEIEPLPESSPLWTHDDVLVTPHVGGRTNAFPDRFSALFTENYTRWKRGDPLRNRIHKE